MVGGVVDSPNVGLQATFVQLIDKLGVAHIDAPVVVCPRKALVEKLPGRKLASQVENFALGREAYELFAGSVGEADVVGAVGKAHLLNHCHSQLGSTHLALVVVVAF